MALNSYAELQQYLTAILTQNVSTASGQSEQQDSLGAPHGAFWATLPYAAFVTGNVPNVNDPTTGKPVPILVQGNSRQSNLILALQGATGSPFDPDTGAFGQMPADGPPFLTAVQIKPIADWIDAGCPE